jgi:hypothetical protein
MDRTAALQTLQSIEDLGREHIRILAQILLEILPDRSIAASCQQHCPDGEEGYRKKILGHLLNFPWFSNSGTTSYDT